MEAFRSLLNGDDQIWSQSLVTYYCECKEPKIFRLTFSGGSSGIYEFEGCKKCCDEIGRKFLIKEEEISCEGRYDQI